MKAWLVGGGAAVLAGVGLVVCFPKKTPAPAAVAPESARLEIDPGPMIPPLVPQPLPAVVDVTDIAPLLDPPATPPEPPATPGVIAVGFDEPANPLPAAAPPPRPVEPQPIPPAADDAADIAPMPREVARPSEGARVEPASATASEHPLCGRCPGWDDEYRSPAGPLWLDRLPYDLVEPLPPAELNPYHRRFRELPDEMSGWRGRANPLLPLWTRTDVELAAQAADWVGPVIRRPAPVGPTLASVGRATSLLHVAAQAPATRVEWYDRWHGTGPLPDGVVPPPDRSHGAAADRSLILDQGAVAALREEDVYPQWGYGRWNARDGWIPPTGPIAALVWLTDAHLVRQRDEAARPVPVSKLALPVANRFIAPVRRAVAVLYATDQAPASRAEWYARWYGSDRFPVQAGRVLTAEDIRDRPPPFRAEIR